MAEVNDAYKQDKYAKKYVEKFHVKANVKVFAVQDDRLASPPKMNHYIDPCATHMDPKSLKNEVQGPSQN